MIKAVVNINMGCYEQIYEPSFENSTWDFYTFTDLTSREHRACSNEYFFEPLEVEDEALDGLSSKRKASYFKAKALTTLENLTGIDYDLVVVIDSNIEIVGELDEWIDRHHSGADFSVKSHPDCKSYLDEVQKIEQIKSQRNGPVIETTENMEETLDEMTRLGFKFNNGYHETNLSIRTNTKRTKAFEKAWAKNYLKFSTKRDQPSLAFTRHEKKNIFFNTLNVDIRKETDCPFRVRAHKYNAK